MASFTPNDFTMNTDPKGVKQWYKRLVESPMDQQEEAKVVRKSERDSERIVRVERATGRKDQGPPEG